MSGRPRALITGAAVRLGRALALDLAEAGWDVAIHYNGSGADAEATATDVRARGGQAVTLQADLLIEDQVAGLIDAASAGLGGALTLLINNASLFENDDMASMTRSSWDRSIETNLRAPVKLTQDFAAQVPAPQVDAGGEPVASGVVINMIDQRVYKPTPWFMSYSIAKAGLYAFTRTAAQALAPAIRVAGIGPGPTIIATNQSDDHFAMQRRASILGRGSDPEDIVSGMRFILANKAFTGQMLAIDGGQHLIWQTPDIEGPGQ